MGEKSTSSDKKLHNFLGGGAKNVVGGNAGEGGSNKRYRTKREKTKERPD